MGTNRIVSSRCKITPNAWCYHGDERSHLSKQGREKEGAWQWQSKTHNALWAISNLSIQRL